MKYKDSIKWLENLKSDIGKGDQRLWHYEQALNETISLLKSTKEKIEDGIWFRRNEELERNNQELFEQFSDYRDKYNTVRDKIENETLVELPCKVGSILYIIECNTEIVEIEVTEIHITGKFILFDWEWRDECDMPIDSALRDVKLFFDEGQFEIKDMGNTVFLTRKEAEVKLNEIKHSKL